MKSALVNLKFAMLLTLGAECRAVFVLEDTMVALLLAILVNLVWAMHEVTRGLAAALDRIPER